MQEKLPTLITLRSAYSFRDEGIHYAMLRCGLFLGLAIAMIALGLAQYFAMGGELDSDTATWLLLTVCGIALVTVAYCSRRAKYPHFPRLTLDELEALQYEMGLSAENFKRTSDSVLHGSFEEHRAMDTTDTILDKLRRVTSK